VAARDILEMIDEGVVHRGATERADHREGLRCDLLRDDQSEPRSDLGDELRRMGAPSLRTLRSATKRAASVTVLASIPRTAKYPLSDASAEPARPPNAKTSTHDSAVSGSERSSPSLCAMTYDPEHVCRTAPQSVRVSTRISEVVISASEVGVAV
jgi:hypothetical protein